MMEQRVWVTLLTGLATLCTVCPASTITDQDERPDFAKTTWGKLLQREPRAVSVGRTDFTSLVVKKILTKHNKFRSSVSPSASNMRHMTWDADLAGMAQSWADRCQFDHDTTTNKPAIYDTVGQNVFLAGGKPNKAPSPSVFVSHWHSEMANYRYDNNWCSGECGHYTQVVWADTHKIGCGLKYCSSIGGRRNAWFIVCNYGPGGNFHGEKPYVSGDVCSRCGNDGPFCYRGLCHQCNPQSNAECTCSKVCKNCGTLNRNRCRCNCPNGFHGSDCGEECRDTHDFCRKNPGWPDESFCTFDSMTPNGCPLMCGQCNPRDRNYRCANPNGSPPSGGGGTNGRPPAGPKPKKPKTKKSKKNKKNKKNKKGGKKGRRG